MRELCYLHRVVATIVLAAAFATTGPATGQPILAHGLHFPYKMAMTPGGNLLVAESGTGANDGRLLMIAPHGVQHVLLSGLPSGIAPQGEPLGPTAVADAHRTLYVLIGEGDILGPAPPGSHVPNPNGWSSALFSSVARALARAPVMPASSRIDLGRGTTTRAADSALPPYPLGAPGPCRARGSRAS
jgi:hypothetical protein